MASFQYDPNLVTILLLAVSCGFICVYGYCFAPMCRSMM